MHWSNSVIWGMIKVVETTCGTIYILASPFLTRRLHFKFIKNLQTDTFPMPVNATAMIISLLSYKVLTGTTYIPIVAENLFLIIPLVLGLTFLFLLLLIAYSSVCIPCAHIIGLCADIKHGEVIIKEVEHVIETLKTFQKLCSQLCSYWSIEIAEV